MNVMTDFGYNSNLWFKYVTKKRMCELMDMLVDVLLTANSNADRKTVIVTASIDSANKIAGELTRRLPLRTVGVLHSGVSDKDERKKTIESEIIVSLINTFKDAIDLPGLKIMINLVSTKNSVNIKQMKGRLRDLDSGRGIYIDLVDVGFGIHNKHLMSRLSVVKGNSEETVIMEYDKGFNTKTTKLMNE